ncbi:hypothetical protein, partial [Synechococcus sp. CS-1332]|uniref:beta strand repeat-containing protein n=1 Tax=Synechococcus sp. CS-1332 TaxID=2847972 RepID=UPI00223C084F
MASSSYSINFNGLLAELGERQIYTFEGVVGDRIYFDGIDADPTFQNISYSLIDPSGGTIFNSFDHTGDSAPGTLTLSGTYQIVIRGDASTTGDYNFNLIKLNQSPVLSLGTTISDSLTPGLESNVYRFTGTRGQRLQFDSLLGSATSTTWTLYGPNNQAINPFTFVGSDFSVTLPTDGEYYLILDGTNNVASVNYSFQVNDISDSPPASPTAFPFVRTGTVAGTPVDFTFTAAAGKLLYFDSLDQDFDGVTVTILDPSGAFLTSSNASSDINFPSVLPRSGTYTVRLNGTGDFSFRLLDVAANATPLTLGTTVTETVTPTSGARIFSFTGAVGQRLLYDALEQDFDSVQTFLIGPSGNNLSGFFVNASSDSDIFTLSQAGTYYLVQESTGQGATDFSFQLLQTPATDLAFDAVTSSTLAPLETELYRFTGTAGQRLVFDSQSPSASSANVFLRGPNGESITSGNLASDFEITLTRSGSHILYIDSSSASSIPYTFQLVTPTTTSTALTLSSPVAGTISELGEQDIYTFAGTAGQRLIYDATVNNGNALSVTLLSPTGAVVGSTIDTDFDGGLVTLTETGTYQLLVEGNVGSANSTGNYNFKLIDATAAPTINLDAVTTGTLTPGAESDFYRFTAATGQRLVFDAISSVFSANFRVFDQGNTQITGANIGFDTEFTVPEAGTYLLEIEGNSTTPVSYSFQLVSPTTTSTPLTLGSAVNGTINELGEQDIYTFTGTVGQRLFYDATVNNGRSIFATLRSPGGAVVGSTIDADFDGTLVTLTETGTYQLLIEGIVGNPNITGNYNFQLIDVTAATTINLDAVTTGTLTPGAESEFFRFTAAAGQRLVFDAITGSGANFGVFDQGNTQITGANIGFDTEFTVPEAGTYLLQIEGNQFATTPVNYSFQLVTPTTTSTPLTLGSAVSSTISELGEQDIYTFAGTAGQRLFYDATVNNGRSIFATLRSPSGAVVGNTIDADFDGTLVTLTETGTYQLLIEGSVGSNNSTGNYNFKLIDASAAPTLTLDTVTTGTLTPGAESEFYRFTAAAGQRFAFDAITGSGASFLVFDPGNTQITAANNGFDNEFTVPEAGTYLLQIEGNQFATTPVNYSFQLVTPTTTSTPLTLGSAVNGSIGELGEQDIYTFAGTAGQRLFYDATVNNGNSLAISLRSPSGVQLIFSSESDFDGSLLTLTETGTYRLTVEGLVGNANSTGNYNFKLIDASTAPPITLGTPITGILTPGAESDFYRFSGTAGQRLNFDSLAVATGATWRLFDPSNQQVAGFGVGAGTDFTAFLDAPGTYLLQIDGNSASDVTYNFTVTNISDAAPATPTAFPFSQSGSVSGAPVDFTITAAAGKLLFVDSLDPDFDGVSLQILDQGNFNSAIYTANAGNDSGAGFVLPRSGNYTVRVNGSGDYNFRILDLAANSTALSLGTATSGPLAAATTQAFLFNGSAGQRLYFDSLEEDGDNITLALLRPDGSSVLGGSGEADSFPSFSLSETGPYHLLLLNSTATAVDFNFALRDLATATALSFNTVTNGSLSPGQETDLYRFTGTAGQRLVFDSQTPGFPSVTWRIFGPANQSLANQNITTDLELNLTADGTYTLAIDGASATSVNYSFSLVTPATTTTALSLNTPVSGTLGELGERDIFTFSGTVGQRLFYDALTNDFSNSLAARLIDPSGDNVFFITHSSDSNGPFTLTE